jgi:UDP-N-acetylglucosamine transferase subunit ALG13
MRKLNYSQNLNLYEETYRIVFQQNIPELAQTISTKTIIQYGRLLEITRTETLNHKIQTRYHL